MIEMRERLEEVLNVVREAELAIMDVYESGTVEVKMKADDTPLTQADMAAHLILTRGFAELFPGTPVVSEEGDADRNRLIVASAPRYILTDPLDNTKAFARGSGDFSICVAEIGEDGPAYGVVALPQSGTIYHGGSSAGSFRRDRGDEKDHQIQVVRGLPDPVVMQSLAEADVASRAYAGEHYPDHKARSAGSQLKILQIAQGRADVYPRVGAALGLWDLAAGQAILEGAGGKVTTLDGGPVDYHGGSLLVGDFIASNGA